MSLRDWVIRKLGGCTRRELMDHGLAESMHGYDIGKKQARIEFAILPLPFTAEQLAGKEYGTFITPNGFASTFGEGNIPAPGKYGYAMAGGYIRKRQGAVPGVEIHNERGSTGFLVFPTIREEDRDLYVPVIVVSLQ